MWMVSSYKRNETKTDGLGNWKEMDFINLFGDEGSQENTLVQNDKHLLAQLNFILFCAFHKNTYLIILLILIF